MSIRPSSMLLALAAATVMGMGLYFAVLRPPMLPEDARYLGASLATLEDAAPGLSEWLRHVFWVMGGFMFATGLLTFYVAVTAFRARARGATVMAAIGGASSVGSMVAVNFLIASDFRWQLLLLALVWTLALACHWLERPRSEVDRHRGARSAGAPHADAAGP